MSDGNSAVMIVRHLSKEQRDALMERFSRYYPLSEEMIDQVPLLWDWEALSTNKSLKWSIGLIQGHEDRWDWERLSKNGALPWSEELTARYEDRWDWEKLSERETLAWDKELIARYEDRWDWKKLSGNGGLPPSRELVDQFSDRWHWGRLHSKVVTECFTPEEIRQVLALASEEFTLSEDRQQLLRASQNGDAQTVRDLVGSGIDSDIGLTSEDAPDVALKTPLLQACKEGHAAVAEALLDAGADPDVADEDGRTALDSVAEEGPLPLTRLLMSAGVGLIARHRNDPTATDAQDLIRSAHEKGNSAVADVLHIGMTLHEHDSRTEAEGGDTEGGDSDTGAFEEAFGPSGSSSDDPDGAIDETTERLLEFLDDEDLGDESGPSKFALLRAARDGDPARVQELLDKGADPNTTAAGRYLTPLMVATAFGQKDVADLLLKSGAHPALGLSLGEKTCLMVAATCGEAEITSSLVEAGASIGTQSKDGQPWGNGNRKFHRSAALTYAIYGGHVETVRTILEKADEKSPDPPAKLLQSTDIAGHPLTSTNQALLHPAAREGHLEMAELLLKYGADPTQTDSDGRAPLDVAEDAGSQEVAGLLHRHEEQEEDQTGESSQAGESSEPSALDQELIDAALEGSVERVEQLIDEGADPSVKDESGLPLIRYPGVSDAEVLKVLLKAGADPNARDEYSLGDLGVDLAGATRLHVWFGTDSEVAEHLLEAGADPNARDSRWATPLYYHVFESDISQKLLSVLLEAGADPNAKTRTSRVPLHAATGDRDVTRRLLEAGADPNVPGNHEERDFPLHIEKDPEIMPLLLEAGADPNALNRQRLTPLMLAMKWSLGTLEQIECLLENGADPNIQNAKGKAALHLLAENTDPDADFRREATSLLLRHGADSSLREDNFDDTPYELAERNDNSVVMDALR
ncbi:ankyrin repeat domain-containing protein [Salinibacter sp.]|nr:ankyrin repeat domain-containing protein [Salinibacter sp.]